MAFIFRLSIHCFDIIQQFVQNSSANSYIELPLSFVENKICVAKFF